MRWWWLAAAEEAASRTVRCVQRHRRRRCPVRLQGRLRQVVSAAVWDRQGPAEVYDGVDEKPVLLCRRQWYHSCNHSQGHSKEGGYDKPNNRVDDLFGQRCRNRANKANLVWICVRTSSSSSLTRSWAFFFAKVHYSVDENIRVFLENFILLVRPMAETSWQSQG